MNVECYRRAVKMTMHPDKRVPVGRKIKNGKRLYSGFRVEGSGLMAEG